MMDERLKNLIDTDIPSFGAFTKKIVRYIKQHPMRLRGGVRWANGDIVTDKELEKARRKARKLRIP